MKLNMNIMSLQVTPPSYIQISIINNTDMTDTQISEVGETLQMSYPKILYANILLI
jgi:hypothetical protein